jgi:enamine deaminase RidA (YjgF/YER057c/UK114 family)
MGDAKRRGGTFPRGAFITCRSRDARNLLRRRVGADRRTLPRRPRRQHDPRRRHDLDGTDGKSWGEGDAHAQTVQTLRNIERALVNAGATIADVVRTRFFCRDIARSQEIGQAHVHFFRDVRPGSTMVQIKRLVDPDMLVEIEADAIVES